MHKLVKVNEGYVLLDEESNEIGQTFGKFKGKKLSLKNCQAIENDYDLDELAVDSSKKVGYGYEPIAMEFFKRGFMSAMELREGKKYSEEDVLKELNKLMAVPSSTLDTLTDDNDMVTMKWFNQSPQPKEWSVEVETIQYGIGNDENGRPVFDTRYVLDSDGCLILKRI